MLQRSFPVELKLLNIYCTIITMLEEYHYTGSSSLGYLSKVSFIIIVLFLKLDNKFAL